MIRQLSQQEKQQSQHSIGGKDTIQKIQQTKANLDETIEELNQKLHSHFSKKQQELIEQYKKQLIQAQKELNQLKSNTNEEQIKARMLQRKKQLENQRHQLIQTNMFFSSKCEDYKKKLADLLAEGKELQRELIFMDSQINNAHKKKYQALSEAQKDLVQSEKKVQVSSIALPLFSQRKSKEQPMSQPRKLANSVSMRTNTKKNIVEEAIAPKFKKSMVKNQALTKLSASQLQKTVLEQMFEQTVEAIREKRKTKRGMPSLKGEEFSDYEKKQIMEEFLSKQEVKRKIYEIIFQAEEKQLMMGSSVQTTAPKVKISYEDIS